MRHKREKARQRAAEVRERAEAQAREAEAARRARIEEVVPWLRSLGFSLEEARRGAACGADMPEASLEERVRVALSHLAPSRARKSMPVASGLA